MPPNPVATSTSGSSRPGRTAVRGASSARGAFVVGEALGLDEVGLETANGVVPIRLERRNGRIAFGWMKQPPFPNKPYDRADEVLAALGLERSLLPVEVYVNGPNHVFVQLPDEASVAALDP